MSASPTGKSGTGASLRHVLGHLVTPLLMCIGMGLAYLGAFHAPEPHHLRVDVVGSGQSAQVLAQTLHDKGAGALDVRTVVDRSAARSQLMDREIYGAYVPGAEPELMVATAGSDTTATVVQKVFTELAAKQGAPLRVTDVAPVSSGDPTGQGLFFLLVALSIGSYASVAVIGGAGAVLPLRIRALLALGMSLVVSAIGAVFAGPLFHLVDQGLAGVWAMSWLYTAGILLVGVGLHTFLKRWTTLGVMVLFVMLNFTSSGGIFKPELQSGFFASLHSFWNGAGFIEGARGHVNFDGNGVGRSVLVLALWFVAGAAVMGAAALGEAARRRREAAAPAGAEVMTADAEAGAAAGVPAGRPALAGRGAHAGPVASEGPVEEELEEAVGV
ncbi:hypothetical protein ACH4SP_13780 [Streptomyces sp. NPDC021093]|uniref:hypothetical protein n=1 Tax=Streptomyces sp. NPDC021093 TaxID=3365112 RepID=UPI0037B13CE7